MSLLNQYPRAVMMASEMAPWQRVGSEAALAGYAPLASSTMVTFLFLSAQMNDPEEGSAIPKESFPGLNFLPQGQLPAGMVSQPSARVLLYLGYLVTLRKRSVASSEKTREQPGSFPLLSMSCIQVMRSVTVEKSPALPAVSLRKWAILLQGVPQAMRSVYPEGAILERSVLGRQTVSRMPAMVRIWKKASGRVLFWIFIRSCPRTMGPSSLSWNLVPSVKSSFRVSMALSSSAGVLGKAAVQVTGIPELCSSKFWTVTYPLPLLLKSKKMSPTLEVVSIFFWSHASMQARLMPTGSVSSPRSNFMSTVTGGAQKPYLGPVVPQAFLKRVALLVEMPSTQPVKMRSLMAFWMAFSTLVQSQAPSRTCASSRSANTTLIINNLRDILSLSTNGEIILWGKG